MGRDDDEDGRVVRDVLTQTIDATSFGATIY